MIGRATGSRNVWSPLAIGAALGLSVAAHAAILAIIVDMRDIHGLDRGEQRLTVSISEDVFQGEASMAAAPAASAAPPSDAAAQARAGDSADSVSPAHMAAAAPVDGHDDAQQASPRSAEASGSDAAPTVATETLDHATGDIAVHASPAQARPDHDVTRSTTSRDAEDAAPAEADETAVPVQALEATPVDDAVDLPEQLAHVPTARPDPQALAREREEQRQRQERQRQAAAAQAQQDRPRQAPRETQPASPAPSSAAPSSAAPASQAAAPASAGEQDRYGRLLLAHVERYKRYPEAARRQGQSGAARLSITIDRNGALVGASLAGSSGHAVLDEEALGVARRAAPYPAPPAGVGGTSFSFAVTLRFSR